jgi:hypothetical protein
LDRLTVLRKLAAILLIFILLFNIGGYRVAISLLQTDADRELEALLDNSDYDESELIEIKVALNMPYQQRFTDYERHYGHIEIDGKSYTYVKKKIEGDVVIFKCIANESKQQLKGIENDLTKAVSASDIDHTGQSKQQSSSFAKYSLSEYDDQNMFQLLNHQSIFITPETTGYYFYMSQFAGNTPHQPPEC